MREFPPWVFAVFGRRVDWLDQQLQAKRDKQLEGRKEFAAFQHFMELLNLEQRDLYCKWEEQRSLLAARERESLYLYGFFDGLHLQSIYADHAGPMNRSGCFSAAGPEGTSKE
ncbi:hypothetical protein [Paenibacillus sp. S150]|uniref:hypothetical protein n=1 Tax=Paenibacillus sp. S150 TaxID=2749826 RepID=UPI001C584DC4|nr:hypothetical protein [Paenibacillus sp. S150]MBW4081315.1 hypothetical protein [Paenibacillus sp. S150]